MNSIYLGDRRVSGFALGADPQPKVYDRTTKSIAAHTGESFLVTLSGNPTTGYEWRADPPSGVVTIAKPTFATNSLPAGSPVCVGCGGTYTFAITAVAPGSTTLHFVYARAWEDTPANELSMEVVVDGVRTDNTRTVVLISAGALVLVAIGGIWYIVQ
jgi:inhibitor of cysteine peptidase